MGKSLIRQLLIAVLLLAALQPASGRASGLDRMEESLAGVEKIEDLVNDPARLDRYYQAVNAYYRGTIPRERFNSFVAQIQAMNAVNPEIGKRLLQKTPTISYELKTDLKTYGRTLGKPYFEFVEKLSHSDGTPEQTRSTLESLSKEISRFEESLSGSRKEREAAQGKFYQALRAREDFRAAAKAAIAEQIANDPNVLQFLKGEDPDIAILGFDELLPRAIMSSNLPENLKSLIRSQIPRVSDLLKDETVFPPAFATNTRGEKFRVPASPAKTYVVRTFPRPIEAVWKGICLKECVGGGNEYPTPRRWATVILKDTTNYAVEANDSYLGFIQEIGYRFKTKPGLYYATEFGVPEFRDDVIVRDPETRAPRKTKLFDLWLEKAPKGRVRIKSGSEAVNNAKIFDTAQKSGVWNFGRQSTLGVSKDFQLSDTGMADEIVALSERFKFEPANEYGSGMITDLENNADREILGVNVLSHAEVAPELLSKPGLTIEKRLALIDAYRRSHGLNDGDLVGIVRGAYSAQTRPSRVRSLEKLKLIDGIRASYGEQGHPPALDLLIERALLPADAEKLTRSDRATILRNFVDEGLDVPGQESFARLADFLIRDPDEKRLAKAYYGMKTGASQPEKFFRGVVELYSDPRLISGWIRKRSDTLSPDEVSWILKMRNRISPRFTRIWRPTRAGRSGNFPRPTFFR